MELFVDILIIKGEILILNVLKNICLKLIVKIIFYYIIEYSIDEVLFNL